MFKDLPGLEPFYPQYCDVRSRWLVVCGIAYPVFQFSGFKEPWCSTVARLVKRIQEIGDKDFRSASRSAEQLKKWTASFQTYPIKLEAHLKAQAPVFTLTHPGYASGHPWGTTLMETNPLLRDYDFAAIKRPDETYRMIETYLSNDMVVPQHLPVEVSDEVRVGKHGFNEWSFRKHKDDPPPLKRRKK